jgi:hypothetical protein
MIVMTSDEVYESICDWIEGMGECFFDYFCHDNIHNGSWAFYLLGRGFTDHGNTIIEEILASDGYVDQDVLYEIKDPYDMNVSIEQRNAHEEYNLKIMSEFIASNRYYTDKFNEFIKKHNGDS